ncbi:small GTPase, Rho type [Pseudohyphozyma bogoriensis]|nr:small GTPase, Rho type [Pseudohyphozyma bogoriensis]
MDYRDPGLEASSRPYSSFAHPVPSSSDSSPHYSPNPSQAGASTASYQTQSSSRSRASAHATANAKVKLVCVGDGGVGKTCLLIGYADNVFPTEYIPTVFENYVTKVPFGESKVVEFALWDTAGQEEYDRLRPLSYPETDVLLVCFAVDYPASLENVEEKWYPEVNHFCEGVPTILVATKTDLRRDSRTLDLLKAQGRTPITTAEGQAAARRIKAKYAEVSAMKGEGVNDVFEMALREALKGSGGGLTGLVKTGRKKGNRCSIL